MTTHWNLGILHFTRCFYSIHFFEMSRPKPNIATKTINVTLVGARGVGKKSIQHKLADWQRHWLEKNVNGEKVTIYFVDTSGIQGDFITGVDYDFIDAVVGVFTDDETKKALDHILKQHALPPVVAFWKNKCDTVGDDEDYVTDFDTDTKISTWRVSATTGCGLDLALSNVVSRVLGHRKGLHQEEKKQVPVAPVEPKKEEEAFVGPKVEPERLFPPQQGCKVEPEPIPSPVEPVKKPKTDESPVQPKKEEVPVAPKKEDPVSPVKEEVKKEEPSILENSTNPPRPRPLSILVMGPPGVGKTTLVKRFPNVVRHKGLVVSCVFYDGVVPSTPVDAIIGLYREFHPASMTLNKLNTLLTTLPSGTAIVEMWETASSPTGFLGTHHVSGLHGYGVDEAFNALVQRVFEARLANQEPIKEQIPPPVEQVKVEPVKDELPPLVSRDKLIHEGLLLAIADFNQRAPKALPNPGCFDMTVAKCLIPELTKHIVASGYTVTRNRDYISNGCPILTVTL
jgi:hypothetical protein